MSGPGNNPPRLCRLGVKAVLDSDRHLWLVLATGPGNPPAVRFLAGGSGRYPAKNRNRYVLAGLLPGPNRNPVFFGRVGTGPLVYFAVPTFLATIKYLSSDRIMT
jgi:hypothetical protein